MMPALKAPETYDEFMTEYPRTTADSLAGQMLRHYWHPVCLSRDLRDVPYGVRMLGEDLVAFRNQDGTVGLVGNSCPHRRASLEYGQIRPEGLMCSYHGWTFNIRGRCVNMPLEPVNSPLMQKASITAYPAQERGGIIWCYMGVDNENPPAPPRLDILSRDDGELLFDGGDIRDYSYLNWLENVVDNGHVLVLHTLVPSEIPDDLRPYVNTTVDADWRKSKFHIFETDYGMKTVLVQNTADPNLKFVNTMSVVFPNCFRFSNNGGVPPDWSNDRRESGGVLRIIDDTHFEVIRTSFFRHGNYRKGFRTSDPNLDRTHKERLRGTVERKEYDRRQHPAWEGTTLLEDLIMQKSQGSPATREKELLGTSDVGVVRFRRMFRKCLEEVAAGRQPKVLVTNAQGILEADTFKGLVKADELRIGPENMPSSHGGRGLLRDATGKLAFV
jgi:phenylpropionate dioxygenase-like ring-hydroxylating dioxygenase large terminal subunit